MIIRRSDKIALDLMTMAHATRGKEYSGFGFVERKQGELYVYDYAVLDVGSEAYTQIDPKLILPLMERTDAANMKLWLHRHPVGNGKPGPHNWSGTDNATISREPLGGLPELVRWSASIVLTPGGWVGRVDNHITKKTIHCGVVPQADVYRLVNMTQANKTLERLAEETVLQFTGEEIEDFGMTPEDLYDFVLEGLRDGSLTLGDLDELYFEHTDTDFLRGEVWIEPDTWTYSTPARSQRRW
jgi:hypothetical protein